MIRWKGGGNKMKEFWKRFWKEEDGMETIEVVVIIAVLIAVALIFRKGIIDFVNDLMQKIFKTDPVDVPSSDGYEGI